MKEAFVIIIALALSFAVGTLDDGDFTIFVGVLTFSVMAIIAYIIEHIKNNR